MAVAANQPVLVVVVLESLERLVEFVEGGEGLDPEKLLFQGAPEPLDATVALRGADEGWTRLHPQEPKLGLEGAGDKLAPIVVAELQTDGNGFSNAAEGHPGGLLEGGDGLEAIGLQGCVDAQEFAGAVVIDPKDRGLLAIQEQDAGGVGAPHLIGLEGGDRAVMNPGAEFPTRPSGGLQAVATHEETNPLLVGANAHVAQAGVDLPIAFSQERWVGQDAVDGSQEFGIGHDGARSALGRRLDLGGPRDLGIDRGTSNTQFPTHGHQADRASQGSGHGLADHFRFPGTKGSSPERSFSACR